MRELLLENCCFKATDSRLCLCVVVVLRYFVENGVLQIINVSHADRGVYTCVARTPVDGDQASATLLVLGEPVTLGEGRGRSWRMVLFLFLGFFGVFFFLLAAHD